MYVNTKKWILTTYITSNDRRTFIENDVYESGRAGDKFLFHGTKPWKDNHKT